MNTLLTAAADAGPALPSSGPALPSLGAVVLEADSSSVVAFIVSRLLAEIDRGDLKPGDRVRDEAVAARFAVSRTPVREALQKLRELGVIEAAPNRFTRISIVGPERADHAVTVLVALYGAVLTGVLATATDDELAELRAEHLGPLEQNTGDLAALATAGQTFFYRLLSLLNNAVLDRAINSVVHIVKLGSPHLFELAGAAALVDAQRLMLDAVAARDGDAAQHALGVLSDAFRAPRY